VRAGAKDRQGEPDPEHFERFCNVVVPVVLDAAHSDSRILNYGRRIPDVSSGFRWRDERSGSDSVFRQWFKASV
jgi:hypothetical protein